MLYDVYKQLAYSKLEIVRSAVKWCLTAVRRVIGLLPCDVTLSAKQLLLKAVSVSQRPYAPQLRMRQLSPLSSHECTKVEGGGRAQPSLHFFSPVYPSTTAVHSCIMLHVLAPLHSPSSTACSLCGTHTVIHIKGEGGILSGTQRIHSSTEK